MRQRSDPAEFGHLGCGSAGGSHFISSHSTAVVRASCVRFVAVIRWTWTVILLASCKPLGPCPPPHPPMSEQQQAEWDRVLREPEEEKRERKERTGQSEENPRNRAEIGGLPFRRDAEWDAWRPDGTHGLPPEVLLRYSQSGFLGRCPAFSVEVFRDGRVVYDGFHHVRVKGRRERRISPKRLRRLRDVLASLPTADYAFWSAITHHDWGKGRCAFAREIVYNVGQDTRAFRHYIDTDFEAPPCLRHLEYRMLQAVGILRWTGGDPLGDSPLNSPL